MEIKVNKIEIDSEEDLKKFIKEIFSEMSEDKSEPHKKAELFEELNKVTDKTKELLYKFLGDTETAEELEKILEVFKSVNQVFEEILEQRKSH